MNTYANIKIKLQKYFRIQLRNGMKINFKWSYFNINDNADVFDLEF